MTKVSVFGEKPTEEKEKKPIEFVKRLYCDGSVDGLNNYPPREYDNIQLFDEGVPYDIILTWNDNTPCTCKRVYLGHWNDGVL